jgi:adenylate kinase
MPNLSPELTNAEFIRCLTPASQSRNAQDYLMTLVPALSDALTQAVLNRSADPHLFIAKAMLRASKLPAETISNVLDTVDAAKTSVNPLRIIIAGAACSGEGTQCEMIKAKYGVVHISTGDLLRAAVEAGTSLGVTAKQFMEQGLLVPDELIIDVVKERLNEQDCQTKGWLLDGFPRSPAQADALKAAGVEADIFIVLDVPDEILIERVVGRRLDPVTGQIYHMKFSPPTDEEIIKRVIQRSDDTEEKIRVRLDGYNKNVSSIEQTFQSVVQKINGNLNKDIVFANINEKLAATIAKNELSFYNSK